MKLIDFLKNTIVKHILSKEFEGLLIHIHPDFLLSFNQYKIDQKNLGKIFDYLQKIDYKIEYLNDCFFETAEKCAGKVIVTFVGPDSVRNRVKVFLITEFKENKLFRLWQISNIV